MSRKMDKERAVEICLYALKHGQSKAASVFGLSKQRVSKIFRCHKSTVLMEHELTDEDGKERSFKELQEIFRRPIW